MMDNKVLCRESNFELCRIIVMFLVMVVHANFVALGEPTFEDMQESFANGVIRYFVQSLAIICVDVFVLLSGWFGIRANTKKILSFLFQILFFYVLIYVVYVAILGGKLNVIETVKYFSLGTPAGWFIKAYVALFIISPILEIFVHHATKDHFRFVLLVFFFFQTIYDWVFNGSVSWLSSGSSLPVMAFLYLLARYIKIYPPLIWKQIGKLDILLYLLLSAIIAFASAFARYKLNISLHMFLYTNPLVILSSLLFLHFFSRRCFKSKMVNWIAGSVFAVYLLHGNPLIVEQYYNGTISQWFINDSSALFISKTLSYLLLIYIIAILLDQIRIKIWNLLS